MQFTNIMSRVPFILKHRIYPYRLTPHGIIRQLFILFFFGHNMCNYYKLYPYGTIVKNTMYIHYAYINAIIL